MLSGHAAYAPAIKLEVCRSQTRIRDASGPGRDSLDNALFADYLDHNLPAARVV